MNESWVLLRQGFDRCTTSGGKPVVMSVEYCTAEAAIQQCVAWFVDNGGPDHLQVRTPPSLSEYTLYNKYGVSYREGCLESGNAHNRAVRVGFAMLVLTCGAWPLTSVSQSFIRHSFISQAMTMCSYIYRECTPTGSTS
jgi:hypothetical protein